MSNHACHTLFRDHVLACVCCYYLGDRSVCLFWRITAFYGACTVDMVMGLVATPTASQVIELSLCANNI